MTRREVAAWLSVSQPAADRLIRTQLAAACIRIGKRVRVNRARAQAILLGEAVPMPPKPRAPAVYGSADANLAWLLGRAS